MIKPNSGEKTGIPTLADIVVKIDEELSKSGHDYQPEDSMANSPLDPKQITFDGLFTMEFKRVLTRLVYRKLHERLASASHEIVVEIMDEIENALNNPNTINNKDPNTDEEY